MNKRACNHKKHKQELWRIEEENKNPTSSMWHTLQGNNISISLEWIKTTGEGRNKRQKLQLKEHPGV